MDSEGEAEMNWQPIETAPKDGTEILLAEYLFGAWDYVVGFWDDARIDDSEGWTEGRDLSLLNPSHWAAIDAPESHPQKSEPTDN